MNHQAARPAENPLATENIGKLITKFAVPSIIGMLVGAIYNMVDQIFIGQDIGLLGIAATNIAFPLVTVATALALLVAVGSASGFSLSLGAGNSDRAGHIIGNGLSFAVFAGLVLGALSFVFVRPLMYISGATEQVFPLAVEYTRIIAIGLPFQVFATATGHIIRADGSPSYSMANMIVGAVFNVIFDPIFLFVFKWGIAGIAWATTLGQILSSIIGLYYLLKKFKSAPLTRKHLGIRAEYVKTVASLGAASCFNQLTMVAVQLATYNTLRHYGALSVYGSDIPIACVGLAAKVNFIYMAFTIGVAQGCQPIVGFNYGAKNYTRVQKTYKTAAVTVTAMSLVAFLCFQLFPRQIILIFGEDSGLYLQFAERYFRIFMFLTIANGIQPITANFFTSIGKATRGIFISLIRQICFLLPLILILPAYFGLDGIMYAGPIADGAACILAAAFIIFEFKEMNKLPQAAAGDGGIPSDFSKPLHEASETDL